MTPFLNFVHRNIEKYFGRWYEGPEPPKRLDVFPILFANAHPNATRQDWVMFCQAQIREVYKAAWLRGMQWSEREGFAEITPDEIADSVDPDWRHRFAFDLNDPDAAVPEFVDDVALLRSQLKDVWRE